MRKLLTNITVIASTLLVLSACSGSGEIRMPAIPDISLPDFNLFKVYKIPVQQGNEISQEMVDALKPGMSKQQVRYLLGTPLLIHTFNENRWDYIYTNREGSKGLLDEHNALVGQKRLTLHFKDSRLIKMTGDIYPQDKDLAKITREKSRERTITIPADAPRHDEDGGFIEAAWRTVTGSQEKDQPPRKVDQPEPKPDAGNSKADEPEPDSGNNADQSQSR